MGVLGGNLKRKGVWLRRVNAGALRTAWCVARLGLGDYCSWKHLGGICFLLARSLGKRVGLSSSAWIGLVRLQLELSNALDWTRLDYLLPLQSTHLPRSELLPLATQPLPPTLLSCHFFCLPPIVLLPSPPHPLSLLSAPNSPPPPPLQRPEPPSVRQWVEQTRQQEAAAARERRARVRERVVSLAGRRTGGEQLSRGGLSHEDGRSRESNNGEDGGTEVGRPQAASCTHCKANVTASVSASLSPGSRPAGRSDTAVGSEPVASAAVMSAPVDVTAQLHAAMEEPSLLHTVLAFMVKQNRVIW